MWKRNRVHGNVHDVIAAWIKRARMRSAVQSDHTDYRFSSVRFASPRNRPRSWWLLCSSVSDKVSPVCALSKSATCYCKILALWKRYFSPGKVLPPSLRSRVYVVTLTTCWLVPSCFRFVGYSKITCALTEICLLVTSNMYNFTRFNILHRQTEAHVIFDWPFSVCYCC